MSKTKMKYEMLVHSVIVSVISVTEQADGTELEAVVSSREFDANDVPDILADGDREKSLKVYGLTKLLQDRNSQVTDSEEKFKGMSEYFDNYFTQGMWKAPSEGRASGPKKASVDTYLIQAIAELKNISMAQATAVLQKASAEDRKAVKANPKVAAKIAELQALAAAAPSEDNALADLL